ncbi:MAG: hypothetical protein H6R19_217 [Proteobacteria bacterium]|nr:hypothetical protein [Pseudomonadota bacterium]
MTALLALAVAENLFINDFAEPRARSAAHRSADQSAQQGSGNTSQRKPNRASHRTNSSANFGAADCSGSTAGRTPCCADGSTGLFGRFAWKNLFRFTARTTFECKHDYLLQTGEQQKARLPLRRQRKAGIEQIYELAGQMNVTAQGSNFSQSFSLRPVTSFEWETDHQHHPASDRN